MWYGICLALYFLLRVKAKVGKCKKASLLVRCIEETDQLIAYVDFYNSSQDSLFEIFAVKY